MCSDNNEYVFRYKMSSETPGADKASMSKLDFFRIHLQNILDMIIPCNGESEVKVDGFKLINNRGSIHRVFDKSDARGSKGTDFPWKGGKSNDFETNHEAEKAGVQKEDEKGPGSKDSSQCLKNASFYEPTIEYVEKQLESLLGLIDLECNGEVVQIDGFRLKDLSQWEEESECDPADMLGYLATRCDCDCVFCYNKGHPPDFALKCPLRSPEEEFQEIQTRLKHFSPKKKRSLFSTLGACFEAFIHPYFMDVLHEVRKKSERPIRLTTNGSALTRAVVSELSRLNPVHLDIALHSSSPKRRQRLMGHKTPETAINALPLLQEAGVVYDIVIVPWPFESHEEMLEDMEATIAYAARNDSRLIQVSLPGYSRFFSEKELFDHDSLWETITKKVRDLRPRFETPIVVRPAMYEENLLYERKNRAEVIGIVKGSPVAHAGMEIGDVIIKIGSNLIRNRPQARELVSFFQKSEMDHMTLGVLRNGKEAELDVCLKSWSYPYSKDVDTHLGIVFMGTGLRMGYLETLQDILHKKGSKKVLFLTSILVKPLLEQNLRESIFFGEPELQLEIGAPPNRFFGGNICLGDLLVVQDYIDYIREYIQVAGRRPDLVVIPSSPFNLNGWGRDLTGRVYLDIERETGIPVEVLECPTIYD